MICQCKKIFNVVCFTLFLGASTGLANQPITRIEVSGTINPGSADYIRTSLKQSEKLEARAMILVLNTPGGLLSSTRDIVQMFAATTVPVVVYVSPGGARATSAGAVLSLAAHLSAMVPGTNIGAAHPVGLGADDAKSTMGAKVINDTAAMVRGQAGLRKRNVELAEKIVTESLSFSAEEAKAKNIINFVAEDVESLITQMNGSKIFLQPKRGEVTLDTTGINAANIVNISMSWSQNFLHFIADPNISTMLLAVAGMAIYVEVASGFSLIAPGVIGLLLAVLGGVSLSMLPINLAGLMLMGLGLVFFVAEIFVTSFGLLFVAGLVALCLGALFLIDPNAATLQVSYAVLIPMLLAFAIVGGAIAWLIKREKLGKTPARDSLIGQSGTIEVLLVDHRSGTVKVQGELWSFVSEDILNNNDPIEVIARQNLQLKVKRRT